MSVALGSVIAKWIEAQRETLLARMMLPEGVLIPTRNLVREMCEEEQRASRRRFRRNVRYVARRALELCEPRS